MSKALIAARSAIEIIPDTNLRDLCEESLFTEDRAMQVLAFHRLYGAPVSEQNDSTISHMTDERIGMRLGLIIEELKELAEDGFGVKINFTFNVDKDPETYYDITDALISSGYRNLEEVADALGDISYVTDGFAIEAGFDLNEVISEIHASNLTKLGEDGLPIHREDGKILKGPYFVEPDIASILERNN